MAPKLAGAVPELFLTFLAPSFRPSQLRLSTSQRHLTTLRTASKDEKARCDSCQGVGKAKGERHKAGQQKRRMSGLALQRPLRPENEDHAGPIASTSGEYRPLLLALHTG